MYIYIYIYIYIYVYIYIYIYIYIDRVNPRVEGALQLEFTRRYLAGSTCRFALLMCPSPF